MYKGKKIVACSPVGRKMDMHVVIESAMNKFKGIAK